MSKTLSSVLYRNIGQTIIINDVNFTPVIKNPHASYKFLWNFLFLCDHLVIVGQVWIKTAVTINQHTVLSRFTTTSAETIQSVGKGLKRVLPVLRSVTLVHGCIFHKYFEPTDSQTCDRTKPLVVGVHSLLFQVNLSPPSLFVSTGRPSGNWGQHMCCTLTIFS